MRALAWIGRGILAIVTAIGPAVIRAWANVLRDETGKFYAEWRELFIEAVKLAGDDITENEYPNAWERMTARAKYVYDRVRPVIEAQAKKAGVTIPMRLIMAAKEAAVAELKGGWLEETDAAK